MDRTWTVISIAVSAPVAAALLSLGFATPAQAEHGLADTGGVTSVVGQSTAPGSDHGLSFLLGSVTGAGLALGWGRSRRRPPPAPAPVLGAAASVVSSRTEERPVSAWAEVIGSRQ